jgi:hypothetical protein
MNMFLWFAVVMVLALVLGRTFWVYRGSRSWPTADGTIRRLDVESRRGADGHYSRAIFTYEFQDLEGRRNSSTWDKNFSTEQDARDFAARELPIGKQVLVRFDPNDRPTSLDL